jgi:hypothetical protein
MNRMGSRIKRRITISARRVSAACGTHEGSRERVGRMDASKHMTSAVRKGGRLVLAAVLVLFAASWHNSMAATTQQETATQRRFTTPEEALQALTEAAKAQDRAALAAIFGPEYDKLLSGDDVQDSQELAAFVAAIETSAKLDETDEAKVTLLIGEDDWPFPIPLVREESMWRFDTAAGMDEILTRRIGENELSAIAVCRAYVLAQWEYYTEAEDTAHDGLAVYAQKFISTPGKRDGLYWDTTEDEKPSPLGALVAQARAEGYAAGSRQRSKAPATNTGGTAGTPASDQRAAAASHPHAPYHGYYFKILKAQGPHAPGGRFSYVINGNMIAGYALIAYPAKWGSSGVMTFIVNQQGRVYQKNLGPQTAQIAAVITVYDPDPSWQLVPEE